MKKILYKSLTVLMIISLLLPIFCHGALATDFNSIYPYNVIKETNPNALNEAEENGTSTVTVAVLFSSASFKAFGLVSFITLYG